MSLPPYDLVALMRNQFSALDGIGKELDTVLSAQGVAARMMGVLDGVDLQHHALLGNIDAWPELTSAMNIPQAYRAELLNVSDALAGITAHYPAHETISAHFARELATIGRAEDYLVGLKALMPAEQLSRTIGKSLMLDAHLPLALNPTIASFQDTAGLSDRMAEFASWSDRLNGTFASLDMGAGIADLLTVSDITRSIVGYETAHLSRAYETYAASVVARPAWLESAPAFVRTAPAQSLFAQGRFVQAVTVREIEVDAEEESSDEIWLTVQTETQDLIAGMLPRLRPSLMTAWEGAWRSAKQRGPDWARQSAASMRFVLIEVLNAAAPVGKIEKTTLPKGKGYIKQDGGVSRPGQVYWLCAPLKNKTYKKFIEADLESAMTIIDAMNEAVHRDDYREIEDAFETMYVRGAVALRHLLQLWRERN